ncbi:hypothetical protein FRC08_008994 [Ceratobasidium sp. 394]|nr:hypothetical protein FRC08_008994 [Ceratobasidium sp. 394]
MRVLSLVFVLVAGLVGAQNIPSCVLSCSGPAAMAVGCANSLDLKCVCDHLPAFAASVTPCILTTCSLQDQTAALGLQNSLCAAAGVSPTSGSGTTLSAAPVSASSSPSAITGAGAPAPAAPTSAASANGGFSVNGATDGARSRISVGLLTLGASVVFFAL